MSCHKRGILYQQLGGRTNVPSNFVGLCGGSASGKTTVARRIIEHLDVPWVSLLSMDSFYKVSYINAIIHVRSQLCRSVWRQCVRKDYCGEENYRTVRRSLGQFTQPGLIL